MDTPNINIIKNEKQPENRKEIVMMFVKAIKDANQTGTTTQQINAIKHYIMFSQAEIPADKWDRDILTKLYPTYEEIKKTYIRQVKPLIAEAHHGQIERWQQQTYLQRLQRELMRFDMLLKEHTGWKFDQEIRVTHGK
jgi:hypothetical protein